MKKITLIIVLLISSTKIFSQGGCFLILGGLGTPGVPSTIIRTSDGGFAVGGVATASSLINSCYIAKMNSSGTLQWGRIVGSSTASSYTTSFASIIQTSDGGYIGTGIIYNPTSLDDACIVKLSSTGAFQWGTVIGTTTTDAGYSLVQTNDGGYLVSGFTNNGSHHRNNNKF